MTKNLPRTAGEAVRLIHKNADDELYVQCRTFGDGSVRHRSWRLNELESDGGLEAFLSESKEQNVGCNVALRKAPLLDRCMGNADAEVFDVFFVDLDVKEGGLTSKEEGLSFLNKELGLEPTLIIDSGGGLHAYFTLSAPIEIENEQKRIQAASLSDRFSHWVRSRAMELHGWKLDSVKDLGRIAGLPFSFNHKTGEAVLRQPVGGTGEAISIELIEHLIGGPKGDEGAFVSSGPSKAGRESERTTELASIEMEWIEETRDEQQRGRRSRPVDPNAAAVVEGCAVMQNFFETPDTLPYEEWIKGLSVLKACFKGEHLAHAASAGHNGYSYEQTSEKLRSLNGPARCASLANSGRCNGCPFRGRISSPIELGSRTADEVRNLVQHVYVQETDELFDLSRNAGIGTDRFRKYHASQRSLSKHADEAFLRDSLARRANRRTFDPRKPDECLIRADDGTLFLNTYRAPKHDLSTTSDAALFLEHLAFLIPDEAERDVVIKWFAHLVQRPWEKLRFSIVLVGGQGTGKSALVKLFKSVLGGGNVNVAKGSALLSRFNGHLCGGVLLFLEEVSIQGRLEAYEGMKTLVTEEMDSFERKGKDIEVLPTPRGLMLLSNDPYALHLPENDRRFFVVNSATQAHDGGRAYYERLFNVGADFAAAVYQELMNVDLIGFSPNQLPFVTRAKATMVLNSRSDIDVLVQEMIDDEQGVFAKDLVAWEDIKEAVRQESADKSVSDKRIRRALLEAGAKSLEGQVRLKGRRVRLWAVRDVERYEGLVPTELASAYEERPAAVQTVMRNVSQFKAANSN